MCAANRKKKRRSRRRREGDGIELISVVDDRRKRATTKALDVSLNELADMYAAGELTIRPEFQRMFRWPLVKQSQFVESLILEMPIPQIFVIEIEEGQWELIDGLQRISSYLHFRGLLNAPDNEPKINMHDKLELESCDIVPELNGMNEDDLPTALRIRLKRAFLSVQVIRKDTDSRFRYYMFKRLNTGGEPLSDQEVRNCTIRLLGDKFNSFIQEMSQENTFRTCIDALTSEKRRQMGDVELVLRYFAFKNSFEDFSHDIGTFLTTYMERVTDEDADDSLPFDYDVEREEFERVFGLLKKTLGRNTCRSKKDGKYAGQFRMHHFEAFSLGVAKVVGDLDVGNAEVVRKAKRALNEVKGSEEFRALTTGGGKNSPGPYLAKINYVADHLQGAV